MSMRLIRSSLILTSATLAVAFVFALPTYGAVTSNHVHSFVEHLIERGIIPGDMAARARALVAGMTGNADINVTVHELIQHSPLTVSRGDTIQGIVLLAENTGAAATTLRHKEGCGILYRIFSGEELIYDHSSHESCVSAPQVGYVLEPAQSVMFEVVHTPERHELAPGTYRFEVEYPGYGALPLT